MLRSRWEQASRASGAIAAGAAGLISSVGLIILSPAFWVKVLGFPHAVFPSDYPALLSMPFAFVAAWLVSLATASRSRGALEARTDSAQSWHSNR